ncbi:MAG: hypothetical protein Q7S99_08525 [Parvibaculum sp.]|nr:hypothetical protein [Parvibaculum sp.]
MKSFLAIAGLGTALVAFTPLAVQAQPYGHQGQPNKPGASLSVTVTKTQVRQGNDYSQYRVQRGHIMPLGQVVRQLENRTGATVTDINLAKNGKFYNFEGVTARGFIVEARADAYDGTISNVKTSKYRPKYDPKGMPINQLLAGLRDKGFQNFDLVSLKDQRGVYQVRGLNRRGQPVMLRVHAMNGRVLSQKATNSYNGPSYARAEYRDFDSFRPALEQKKFSRFDNVVAYDDYYQADARDDRGRAVTLLINAFTGAILNAQTR